MTSNLTPDSASEYGHDWFAVNDLETEETFSIDLLLTRVEELQRSEKLESLQKLSRRNTHLQQIVIEYQSQWCCALNLLEKTYEARLSIQNTIEKCVNESAVAERIWLAHWGIKKEHPNNQKEVPSYAGWI
jgi:hypothetical protein